VIAPVVVFGGLPRGIPLEVVELAKVFFASITIIALGVPLIRGLTKGRDRRALPQEASPDVTARLERIEQAVEAVAIEVERIAEAQRYSAKLMTEQRQRSLPDSSAGR
jgi:hypothetical protein